MSSQWFRIRYAEEKGRRFISSATLIDSRAAARSVLQGDVVVLASTLAMIALMAPSPSSEAPHSSQIVRDPHAASLQSKVA